MVPSLIFLLKSKFVFLVHGKTPNLKAQNCSKVIFLTVIGLSEKSEFMVFDKRGQLGPRTFSKVLISLITL